MILLIIKKKRKSSKKEADESEVKEELDKPIHLEIDERRNMLYEFDEFLGYLENYFRKIEK